MRCALRLGFGLSGLTQGDRVNRQSKAERPDQLWVSDHT